jgi:nucleoid-associated protein YgaU
MSGCSTHIPPELSIAEEVVTDARRAGAAHTARDKYQEAKALLDQARLQVEAGDDEEASETLLQTIIKGHEAELAAYLFQLEATEMQLDSAEEYILRLEEQRNTYFEALSNIYDEQKLADLKVSDSNSYKPSSNYRVRSGENLFAIAAKRKVYGDALLWPLIYKANRDQIKDPQQIYPGQVLTIPRGISDEEKEEARTTARESKIFQPPATGNGKK